MSSVQEMKALLAPKSIAIIGASSKDNAIGNIVVKNLIESKFEGAIYPINPKAPEIRGIKAYPSILDVPGDVDMAVFCVPAKAVLGAAEECSKKHVKGYVIITSGFSEIGHEGAEVERKIVEAAKAGGGRVMGPNIVGVLLNGAKANASFAPCLPLEGKTALISQSGALLISLDMSTFVRHVGASSMISLGNMSDVDFADCISYYAEDDKTNCIGLYIEGLKNGRAFIEAGRKAGKPIVALKSGVSAHGAAAAASHTGSLAGSVKVYDAAFKQAHVIRAHDLDELLDCSQALALQPTMKGENVCVVTNGGGIGVLSSDSAEAYGIPLNNAPADLQVEFKKCMPDFGSAKNPVDITGGAGLQGYKDAIAVALKSDWVNGLAVLYCETANTQPDEIAEGILAAVRDNGSNGKPIVACFVGGFKCQEAGRKLIDAGIPFYENPDKAMRALSALRQAAVYNAEGVNDDYVPAKDVDQAAARAVIAAARADGRSVLTEPEAKKVFAAYGLPVGKALVAKTEDEAVKMAAEIGYPLVMKIVSPQIIHKSDAGGVKVNIKDEAGVRAAWKTIMENAKNFIAKKEIKDAAIHGILLQSMAPLGKEVIVGSVNDPQFGPTVMFGMGGIFVEVLKDVTFRVAPFSPKTAMGMLPEIKSYKILQGTRGEKRLDQERLSEIISRISQLVSELGDEIAETDANPIMLYPEGEGLAVVDARIILKKK